MLRMFRLFLSFFVVPLVCAWRRRSRVLPGRPCTFAESSRCSGCSGCSGYCSRSRLVKDLVLWLLHTQQIKSFHPRRN